MENKENKIIISDETLKNSKEIVKSMDLKQSCETYFKLDYLTKNIKDELTNNIVNLSNNGEKTILPIWFEKTPYQITPIVSKEKTETISEAQLNLNNVIDYAKQNHLDLPMKIDIDKLVELDWFKINRNKFYEFELVEKTTKAKKPYIKITKIK